MSSGSIKWAEVNSASLEPSLALLVSGIKIHWLARLALWFPLTLSWMIDSEPMNSSLSLFICE